MIYVTVVLVVALRIQLNILGGYLFKEPIAISTEVQQKYLSLCNHLLDDGLMKLKTIIEKEVGFHYESCNYIYTFFNF